MTAPAQLELRERCPRCRRPIRRLSWSARSLASTMRYACGAPPHVLADLRVRARELEAEEPGVAADVACHLGICPEAS